MIKHNNLSTCLSLTLCLMYFLQQQQQFNRPAPSTHILCHHFTHAIRSAWFFICTVQQFASYPKRSQSNCIILIIYITKFQTMCRILLTEKQWKKSMEQEVKKRKIIITTILWLDSIIFMSFKKMITTVSKIEKKKKKWNTDSDTAYSRFSTTSPRYTQNSKALLLVTK